MEDAPFLIFTTQRSYTPDEYKSGFVNFYGGSLGTGINIATICEDEDEDKDEEETDPVKMFFVPSANKKTP